MNLYIIKQITSLPINVEAIEKKYDAIYVGDFCTKNIYGEWANIPTALFWQEKPKCGYNNYFLIYFNNQDNICITSGKTVVDCEIDGIVADDGEIIFSRYRHDCNWSIDGSVMIDGGRDYTRVGGKINNQQVKISFDKSNLVFK